MTSSDAISPSSVAHAAPRGHRAAVLASFLGWTLDAFDFFLVVFALTAIAKEFHKTDAQLALTITVTLAFRPVGAFIFGLMADRYGRKLPLMIDLVFFSIVEVLSGLAPTYTTFFILRALFGIGMGGEWGVGASLAMEKAPAGRRGVLSGLLQEGYATGYLLAAVCYFFVFPRWGWRPMFFIGGLPALLALFVRYRVEESEVWQRTRHKDQIGLGAGDRSSSLSCSRSSSFRSGRSRHLLPVSSLVHSQCSSWCRVRGESFPPTSRSCRPIRCEGSCRALRTNAAC